MKKSQVLGNVIAAVVVPPVFNLSPNSLFHIKTTAFCR